MARKSLPKADNPKQSSRFIQAARELGMDEDEAAFVEKLKKIAKAKTSAGTNRK
jgi:hypothetical protein